jgi:hypothetical protein
MCRRKFVTINSRARSGQSVCDFAPHVECSTFSTWVMQFLHMLSKVNAWCLPSDSGGVEFHAGCVGCTPRLHHVVSELIVMKRLMIFAVVVLVASACGCRCGRQTAYRPCMPAQPCCTPACASPCSSATEFVTGDDGYSVTPSSVMPTPTLSPTTVSPSSTIPGPEVYTPAP